jgi:hypothetical protein
MIVEADHPTSIEQENVMSQDAVDMNDAVASAPNSPNPQDTIIANIEGKQLRPHRKVKHRLTCLQG